MSAGAAIAGARGITIVGASAGSGKTRDLTEAVLAALIDGGLPLEGLVAVTYTRRAQLELASRIRQKLLQSGHTGRAALLPLANVGTVHAACLRLLRELALDAGLSPSVDVTTHDEQLVGVLLEDTLPEPMKTELLRLADVMAIEAERGAARWAPPVVAVMTLARHGRIAPERLAEMAERSVEGFSRLFPPTVDAGLDAELAAALEDAPERVLATGCKTKKTAAVVDALRAARTTAQEGPLDWPTWCRLGKLDPGVDADDAADPVRRLARRVLHHPRLRADMARFTRLVFEAAARTMAAYQQEKKLRQVVDYVDMIDHALDLLDAPGVAEDLASRLRLVVVDELQDSSPIQLALFLRWHRLAGASRWVGDPKQCIFEYAGADPALMDDTVRWVAASGGAARRLDANHRTRADLVEVCNELFGAAFAALGVDRADVCVRAARSTPPELQATPALGVWHLEKKRTDDDAPALAEGIARMLASPAATRVIDRATGALRDVRPGDVAVLVATNAEAQKLADQLARRRIPAAVARSGVLATPEGVTLRSALALLVDRDGQRERAVLHALHGFGEEGPDAWLSARLVEEQARRAARVEAGGAPRPATGDTSTGHVEARAAWEVRLDAIRPRLDVLSPAEAVDAVLAALDLAASCARWPDPGQRLANLDALRALAVDYEARCQELGAGASVAGLFRHFEELTTPVYVRGETLTADAQAEPRGEHAVTILTYHRSKGLEWPVVVPASLGRDGRRQVFKDVVPERADGPFDPDRPLEGRWIRYWPWPFSPSAHHELGDRGRTSPEGLAVGDRERRERVRLLYVGFTRARDHLILAARHGKTAWLDELRGDGGSPVIELPEPGTPGARVRVHGLDGTRELTCRVTDLTRPGPLEAEPEVALRWFARPADSGSRCSDAVRVEESSDQRTARMLRTAYRVLPSEADRCGLALAPLVPVACTVLHPPILLVGDAETAWSHVGSAVHAVLAVDMPARDADERWVIARRLLQRVGMDGDEAVRLVLSAGDAFRAWVDGRFSGARWLHELPVRATLDTDDGEREIVGVIDLLLELPDGRVVIVDHKSDRVSDEGGWRAQAARHAPQLAAYRLAVEATGRQVAHTFVHFVVGGGVVEMAR